MSRPNARPLARFPHNDIITLTQETPVYDLAESVGPDLSLRDLLPAEEAAALAALPLGYRTAAGDAELRAALAQMHGVAPDQVVVTTGGMQALFLTAFILCEPGEEAVTTRPLFPNSHSSLISVGAKVTEIPVSFDSGYRLDLEALRAALTEKTRLVGLASPQNPSGVAIPRASLQAVLDAMAAVCPEAVLLVDETYREAAYGEDPIAESAVSLDERVLVCGSFSKCHGAPGLRIGWAVTRNAALRDQLVLGKFNTVICSPALEEALALRLFQRRQPILAERRRHLAAGLAMTQAWVQAQGDLIEWVRPDAGALCTIRLRPEVFDAAALERFDAACKAHGVRLGDGRWFGEPAGVFRLGFGLLPMPELETGLAALSSALQDSLARAA